MERGFYFTGWVIKKVTFEQHLEESEPTDIWKMVLDRQQSMCKGPEVGTHSAIQGSLNAVSGMELRVVGERRL